MRSDRQPALPLPDAVMAARWREAADYALLNPYETQAERERRAAYCHAQARALQREDGI